MADDKNAVSGNDSGALEELVNARFLAASQSLSRECKARLEKLKAPRVSAWAHEAFKICEDSTRQRAELWIACHRSVADEYGSGEFRSKRSLDSLREKIMRFAHHVIGGLKGEIERRIAAAADGSPAPHSSRYTQLEARVLESVNRGIGLLEAEGKIRSDGPNHSLAKQLREAREEAGDSQAKAAEALELTVSAVARIEQGKTKRIRNDNKSKIIEYIRRQQKPS